MARESNGLEMPGEILMIAGGGQYKVKLEGMDVVVLASLAGKMKQKKIKVILGDKVWVQLNEYDPSKGLIIWRGDKMVVEERPEGQDASKDTKGQPPKKPYDSNQGKKPFGQKKYK